MYLFPVLCSVTSPWQLDNNHGGSIYTTEMGSHLNPLHPEATVKHSQAHNWLEGECEDRSQSNVFIKEGIYFDCFSNLLTLTVSE